MKTPKINIEDAVYFAGQSQYSSLEPSAIAALDAVNRGTGAGSDFLGWVRLPSTTTAAQLADIQRTADALRADNEYVVCIGIGGSYLGARAVVEAMSSSFDNLMPPAPGHPKLLFAGQNISEDYLSDLQKMLTGKRFGIIVISKSGTTTEPAIAFRLLKAQLEAQTGKADAARKIVAITDAAKGALRTLAAEEGYKTFVIPDNVGGRFSVLTAVGLLPIAVAGYNITSLIEGAQAMEQTTMHADGDNPAMVYAMIRNALYNKGYHTEVLANYEPRLHYFGEWWKQLYGESEGKDGKGIFPAAVDLTTDLHSMGQLLQEGERNLFETMILVDEPRHTCTIPRDEQNLDGLNYIAGKRVSEVNRQAALGTKMAHTDGGVPVITIKMDRIDEYSLGQMIYLFEKACGISGYMLGVNPFNQPGVEAYKRNMFHLLGKPGY